MKHNFRKINEEAALKASAGLSKLVGTPVDLTISQVEEKSASNLAPLIQPEETVAAICLHVTGKLKGACLVIFPKEAAPVLADLLAGREPGTSRDLNELDESALKETGNIITGNYLTILSNALGVKVVAGVPSYMLSSYSTVIRDILAGLAEGARNAIVIELEFSFMAGKVKGYYLLLFQIEDLKALLHEGDGLKDLFSQ